LRAATGPLTTLEKVNLALAMTWAAGFVDLVGYVSLYGLYTSQMTGNAVAMARHVSQLEWAGVVRRGWPIVTFVFGLMLGALISLDSGPPSLANTLSASVFRTTAPW